jgi:hypothetical protein
MSMTAIGREGLTAEERAMLFVFYSEHAAAECVSCKLSFRLMQLGSDMLGGRRHRHATEEVRWDTFGQIRGALRA